MQRLGLEPGSKETWLCFLHPSLSPLLGVHLCRFDKEFLGAGGRLSRAEQGQALHICLPLDPAVPAEEVAAPLSCQPNCPPASRTHASSNELEQVTCRSLLVFTLTQGRERPVSCSASRWERGRGKTPVADGFAR